MMRVREALRPREDSPPGAHRPGEQETTMHPCHRAWRSPGRACHPKFVGWSHGGCDRGGDSMGHGPDEFEGGFGVRRPLRFLAHKLELNDAQVAALARVLDELKTERAQAAVDGRRALAEFADATSADAFD